MAMPRIIKIFALRHASTEPFFVVVYSLLMQIVDMRRQLRAQGPPPMRHRGLNMTAFERHTLLTHSQHFLSTFAPVFTLAIPLEMPHIFTDRRHSFFSNERKLSNS